MSTVVTGVSLDGLTGKMELGYRTCQRGANSVSKTAPDQEARMLVVVPPSQVGAVEFGELFATTTFVVHQLGAQMGM